MNAKPLFILMFFAFLITTFAGGAIGDTDLTPDTPPAPDSFVSSGAFAPAVQGIQTGPCGSPYTVQSGDSLSAIARTCALNLADLLAANPQITNANLIRVGQQINLPVAADQPVQAAVEAPVVEHVQEAAVPAQEEAVMQELVPEEQQLAAQEQNPAPTVDAIIAAFETARASGSGGEIPLVVATPQPTRAGQGYVPGSLVEVIVNGFQPNTPVMVGIGLVGSEPFYFDERITDDQGNLAIAAAVPANAKPDQEWTVTVSTMDEPAVIITAEPFRIGR